MSRSQKNPSWSSKELVTLKNMREILKAEWPQIAAHIPGRSPNACRDAYWSHVSKKKVRTTYIPSANSAAASSHNRPGETLLEARERRREAASLRDVTAVVFGDPPPGFSALDEKRGVRS